MESARAQFLQAVDRLRRWADSIPVERRHGEWDSEYPGWPDLYTCWDRFREGTLPSEWTRAETEAILYALARDNEAEHLAGSLAALSTEELVHLVDGAVHGGEEDARWQLAVVLGDVADRHQDRTQLETALFQLAADPAEYVRRRALGSLAHLGSARFAALLREATTSENQYLRDYAAKLREKATPPVNDAHPLLSRVDDVGWDAEAQPPWNTKGAVPNALRALAAASSETCDRAYQRLLYALGNNHVGTYYPVVLAAVPFLGDILRLGKEIARLCTLDVLIDLLGSFEPEKGFELVSTPTGQRPLRELVREQIAGLESEVERHRSGSPREAELAKELLELLAGASTGR
jgi:hypothetical protein